MSGIRRNMMALRSGGGVDWQAMYYGLVDGTLSGEVLLPSGLTKIRDYLLYNFTGVTSITLPDTVTSIEGYSLYGLKITSLDLKNVTRIGTRALCYCDLESINIPNEVTYIGDYAFGACTKLKHVVIGSGITEIRQGAFWNDSAILDMVVNATTPPTLGNIGIGATTYTFPIYVPDGSVATYKSTSGWSSYASRIYSINDMP